MARVNTRNSKLSSQLAYSGKVKFNFDIPMMNSLIRLTQCEYVQRSDLLKLRKLFEYVDVDGYQREVPIYVRIKVLQSVLTSMMDLGLSSPELIRSQLRKDFEPGVEIVDDIGLEKNQLGVSDCEYIAKFINEKLQFIEVYQKKDKLIDLLRRIDEKADYNVSYYETIQQLKQNMGELMVSLQDADQNQGLLREFAFSDADAANLLAKVVQKRQKPTAILQTGIRQLNAILAPGFQSGGLYTILGGSGKFKSGTLLNIADQIRRYNPQIVPFENGMRKCILFITLENSIEETIERLYDMYSDMDSDLRNKTPEEVIATLREQGAFSFTNSSGIDICFRYAGNLEITTAEIYGMISQLSNKGYQPICIILDYIKRIDSAHNSNGDERVRMSFVAKELKSIAQFYQIPVITAMQLNREGNSIIDAAMRDSKQDVARFVGSSSIGNAWDIIEDSDWVCLINLELQKSTGRLFLTFKRLKIRGKKIPLANDYFNHPFVNAKNIRLEPDVDKPEPISVISLANDLESIDEERETGVGSAKKTNLTNLQARTREKRSSESIIGSLKGVVATDLVAA